MNVKTLNCIIFRSLRPCYTHAPVSLRSPCRGHRQSTSQPPKHAKRPERSGFSPTATSKYDWIGPPDRLSNLRPIIYHIPENETPLERKLRHLRQETEDWNHEFWTNQNFSFSKEREEYIQLQLMAKGLSERDDDVYRNEAASMTYAASQMQPLEDIVLEMRQLLQGCDPPGTELNLIGFQSDMQRSDLDSESERRKRTLSSEEMAVFYKHFLDKNITRHSSYNREWYRRNFTITVLMARVALHNTWRTLTGQEKGKTS